MSKQTATHDAKRAIMRRKTKIQMTECDAADNLEKGDLFAILFSGMFVFVLLVVGILLVAGALGYFFLVR